MKSWLDSKTIRNLTAALLLHILTWGSLQLSHEPLTFASLDWRYLVAGCIAILIPFVKRLTDPDVETGVKLLDLRNSQ